MSGWGVLTAHLTCAGVLVQSVHVENNQMQIRLEYQHYDGPATTHTVMANKAGEISRIFPCEPHNVGDVLCEAFQILKKELTNDLE